MEKNYVVYHLHSSLSLSDSATDYKDYIAKAKEYNMKAIAFTEHGNTYRWVDKKITCDNAGIKYIHGCEIYLTESLEKRVRDNYHTILLAKNYEGVKELNSLIELSTRDTHFYYSPRISFDEFFNISDNIIKISSCLASPLNKLKDDKGKAELYDKFCRTYDYFEIQPHINSPEQIEYNKHLYELSKKYGKPLIAGTDTHSLNQYKAECRSIIQKDKKIEFSNEDDFDLTFKSYDELVDMFRRQNSLPREVFMQSIENTNIMADSIEDFKLDTSFKYPYLYPNEEEVFQQRIMSMYKDKVKKGIIKHDKRYLDNIKEEYRVLKKIGMIGFVLFMSEMLEWCRDNGIPYGPCRGSVGGSTVAYITGITDVDPVKWGTVFSRFANEDRVEIGDIDLDFAPSQRDRVYEYIINRFGLDKTAYILAIGTVSDKGTIDLIGRALKIPLDRVKRIKESYEANPEKARQENQDIFYYFDGIINTPVSQSMHPAGIVASPISLYDNYGTFWKEGKQILSIDMDEIHEINLVKYDILGLKNIEIIKDTCELANIDYPWSHNIDWDDQNVWKDMLVSPVGIFQFESQFAFDSLKKFTPTRLHHLNLITAAIRPSGEPYRERLFKHEVNSNPSPEIDELLKDNFGFLVFQEDTISFLQDICGLSGSDADNIRRAIGRKQKDRLDAAMPSIVDGYCKHSNKPREIAEKEVKQFLDVIEASSNYQFGKNHSTGYSMISYICAYLRYYYPIEFITAYLKNAQTMEDVQNGAELAKVKGVRIVSPKFGRSKGDYSFDKGTNTIYKGVGSIKFLNKQTGDELYELSQSKKHDNFVDLLNDILEKTSAGRSVIEILAKLNYFSDFGRSKKILDYLKIHYELHGRKQISKGGIYTVPVEEIAKYCGKETAKQYSLFDYDGLLRDQWNKIEDRSISIPDYVRAEKEYLGYVQLSHSKLKDLYFVDEFKTYAHKNKPYLTLYSLEQGKSIRCKVKDANAFSLKPFVQNSIIKLEKLEEQYRSKWIPYTEEEMKEKNTSKKGQWVKSTETEWVLCDWTVLDKGE